MFDWYANEQFAAITGCTDVVLHWKPNAVTVQLPAGKLCTCLEVDWHIDHETGLIVNVYREGHLE